MTGTVTKTKRPLTFDHLRKKKPVTSKVKVILDDEPLKVAEEAEKALAKARADHKTASLGNNKELIESTKDALDKATATWNKAKNALEEATIEIVFQALNRKHYEQLISDHPNPKPEAERKDTDSIWNPDTFPPALVAAAAIEPSMTPEEAQELFETWNSAELAELFFAALNVNIARRVDELGKGFGGILG